MGLRPMSATIVISAILMKQMVPNQYLLNLVLFNLEFPSSTEVLTDKFIIKSTKSIKAFGMKRALKTSLLDCQCFISCKTPHKDHLSGWSHDNRLCVS